MPVAPVLLKLTVIALVLETLAEVAMGPRDMAVIDKLLGKFEGVR